MARRQRIEFWSSKQYAAFGFVSQGKFTPPPVPPVSGALGRLQFFAFTQPYVIFRSQGQFNGTSPVSSAEYTLSGGLLTELFVTTGVLGAAGVSYPFNPMSKRTN